MIDTLDNLEQGCLQGLGDNTLALVKQLLSSDLNIQKTERFVYFDLLGLCVSSSVTQKVLIFTIGYGMIVYSWTTAMVLHYAVAFAGVLIGFSPLFRVLLRPKRPIKYLSAVVSALWKTIVAVFEVLSILLSGVMMSALMALFMSRVLGKVTAYHSDPK